MCLTETGSLTSGEPNQTQKAAKPLPHTHTHTHTQRRDRNASWNGRDGLDSRTDIRSLDRFPVTGQSRERERERRAAPPRMVDVDAPGAEIFGGTTPSKSPVPYNPDPRVADDESAEEVMELFLNA